MVFILFGQNIFMCGQIHMHYDYFELIKKVKYMYISFLIINY